MSDPLTALAMTGATTIVAAMATSAWELARAKAAAIFRRRGTGDAEAGLERSADRVGQATDPDAVRQEQVTRWRDDLIDLLREHPEAQTELRALIEEVGQRIPPVQQQWAQHITAHSGGTAFGAMGPGSRVNVHHHSDETR